MQKGQRHCAVTEHLPDLSFDVPDPPARVLVFGDGAQSRSARPDIRQTEEEPGR
jgi:hypothetical protein